MREPGAEPCQGDPDPTDAVQLVADGGAPSTRSPESGTQLPPRDGEPARILAVPGSVVERSHRDSVEAMVERLSPGCIVATPPRENSVRASISRGVEAPVVSPNRPTQIETVQGGDSPIRVVTAPARRRFGGAETAADGTAHRVCLTTGVSLNVDPYQRATAVDGLDTYAEGLPDGWLTGDVTHCSTALRAGYQTTVHTEDGACSLVGIGESQASLGVGAADDESSATLLEVFSDGTVRCEEVDPAGFGLSGIDGVGESRATTLRDAGLRTPADVAEAPIRELAELSGFGRTTAVNVQAAAKARATETVVATGDDGLPAGEPVFIDIETDGLEPSVAWLIGVLDGDAETGHYMPFTQPEPGDGSHLEAFMSWLQANASNRPVVAWNGYSFDFPVIRDQLRQHCPEMVAAWDDVYQLDLLWWARKKNGGTMCLPGRNNKLESVAAALGWEPETTGIDGGVVAAVYSAYRRAWLAADSPHAVREPDWERLEAYCEDDVRALATIYDAIEDASRRDSNPKSGARGTDSGTQGALSDFT